MEKCSLAADMGNGLSPALVSTVENANPIFYVNSGWLRHNYAFNRFGKWSEFSPVVLKLL